MYIIPVFCLADTRQPTLGSVGGPKWGVDSPVRPEQGLLALRKVLGLYANIRPANFASDSLISASPLKPDIARGVDIIVLRELIGGLYFGERKEAGVAPNEDVAWDTMIYSVEEIKRITRVAAKLAMTANPPLEIHSIDKANVLACSRLWRKVVTETLKEEYPQIKLDHQLVDSASMLIVANPRKLNGVLLTENLFGDMYAGSRVRFGTWLTSLVFQMNPASSQVPWDCCRRLLSPVHLRYPTSALLISKPHLACTSLFMVRPLISLGRALPTQSEPYSVLPCC